MIGKALKTKVVEEVVDGKPRWKVITGSAIVKIYLTPSGSRELYTVSHWVDGKRLRQVFPSLEAAKAEASTLSGQLARGDAGSPDLTKAQRASFARAMELLAPFGIPLEVAASQVASACKKLGGRVSFDTAIEYYVRRHPEDMELKRVADVTKECLDSKRQDRLSARYLRQLTYDFNQFSARFKNNIGDVTGVEIDSWLRSLDVSPRTRNNLRTSVQTLFSFAKAKRYVAKDHDELDSVALAKNVGSEIGIFRPSELREVLDAAPPELVPFLVLGGFAGVRHAEIQRLDWQDVKMSAGIIEIRAAKAKTASRRTIPIVANLAEWLKLYRQDSGPVCAYSNMAEQLLYLSIAVKKARAEKVAESTAATSAHKGGNMAKPFEWQHNGLRHSFISYRVAVVQNVAQVALEAGNSPSIIFRNYRELVTPGDAKEWFDLAPNEADREKAQKIQGIAPMIPIKRMKRPPENVIPMPMAV